jgi:8-oxo-dGTP pyrophosphatase MutT (NUDIX family)
MWIDYHDRINVLVEANQQETAADGTDKNERRFLVFEQTKYALEGRGSIAIIGGIIESGETPEASARREVEEEMNGLQCNTFHFLGRYRTDVNRGMGWVNSFWATDCDAAKQRSHATHQDSGDVREKVVGAADTERQDLRSVTLTQLKEYVRNGKFIEVQWTATVALALLHPELSS